METGTTSGYTQEIITMPNGILRYTYGKNALYIKQAEHPNFLNHMQLLKTMNTNGQERQGNCVRNFRLMLADVKQRGFSGVVIFEKNPDGFNNLSKAGRGIIENRVLRGIMTKQTLNGGDIFLYENAPIS